MLVCWYTKLICIKIPSLETLSTEAVQEPSEVSSTRQLPPPDLRRARIRGVIQKAFKDGLNLHLNPHLDPQPENASLNEFLNPAFTCGLTQALNSKCQLNCSPEVGCKGWLALVSIVVNYVACVLGLPAVQGEDSMG